MPVSKRKRICIVKKLHKLKKENRNKKPPRSKSQRIAIALRTCGVSKKDTK